MLGSPPLATLICRKLHTQAFNVSPSALRFRNILQLLTPCFWSSPGWACRCRRPPATPSHPLDNAYTNDTTPSPLRLYCVDTHNHSPLDIFRRNDIPTLAISISMQPYYVRVGLGGNKDSYLATLFSLHRPQRLIEFFPLFFSIPISVSRPDKNDIRPLPTFFWEGREKWAAIAGAFFSIHIHHHLSLLHLRPSQPLPTSPSINNLRRGRGSGPIG